MDYLEEVSHQAVKAPGPSLECGSGLTTIMVGLLAGRRGIDTWSLEHCPEWRARVRQALQQFDIPNVQVCLAPLQSLSDFDWYDAPLAEMPSEFRLVICDGPPGSTTGGRYGLLPLMRDRLPEGSVILLDDAARAGDHCQLDWILGSESQAQLASLLSNGAPKTLDALLSRLPLEISALEAEFYWLASNRSPSSKS